jgi:hypothetical protein
MKIRMFRHRVVHDVASGPKPTSVAPAPRHVTPGPPPRRMYSLQLPPGFNNERR